VPLMHHTGTNWLTYNINCPSSLLIICRKSEYESTLSNKCLMILLSLIPLRRTSKLFSCLASSNVSQVNSYTHNSYNLHISGFTKTISGLTALFPSVDCSWTSTPHYVAQL